MAKCKYCHEVISRLDKEICPFCGGVRPLEGTDTSTQDVTKVINQLDHPVKIKHHKRIIAAILAAIFGFLGAHHIYLGKYKKGLITLGVCLFLIAGIGSIIFFAVSWKSPFAYLIPYFATEVYSLFSAYIYLTKHNVQDSHGEFLE